jgi:hypothetical protein
LAKETGLSILEMCNSRMQSRECAADTPPQHPMRNTGEMYGGLTVSGQKLQGTGGVDKSQHWRRRFRGSMRDSEIRHPGEQHRAAYRFSTPITINSGRPALTAATFSDWRQ